MQYLPRYIEKEIQNALKTSGTVVVAGPKFCGKTTTCERFAESQFSLDTKQKIALAEASPEAVLFGATPRLIDEWQMVPDLWNVARREIDHRDTKFGQFLFTGSSTPANKEDIYHSGAGRIVTVEMRTMSLFETGESKGLVSLAGLFAGSVSGLPIINDSHDLRDIAFYICRGGWPLSLVPDRQLALRITKNYCSTLFSFENSKNGRFRNKKPAIFEMMLRTYARNISTEARKGVLINDVNAHEDLRICEETFDDYHEALRDLFIIKDIEAWNPNFRSKTAIISTPTRHFVDTSLAAFALRISPEDLLRDPNTFGLFFEDFAVKELAIYAGCMGGEVRHYRDGNGLECDAVIHLENGQYGLVEIKLGGESLIEEGIRKLKALSAKIAEAGKRPPAFKMVLTATGNAYSKDGTIILPINLLKA